MTETADIPIGATVADGNQLYRWLGSFWTALFEDRELVRRQQQAGGLLSAQLLLEFQETLRLPDHKALPVYHRVRWFPLTIVENEKDTGPASGVRLNHVYAPVIGPQVQTPFVTGQQLTVGGNISVAGVSAYPLAGEAPVGCLGVLTDAITAPTRVLIHGADFRLEDGSVIFLSGNDPFSLGLPTEPHVSGRGPTRKITLWLSDALFDRDLVHRFSGHVLGLKTPSTPFHAGYIGALWDLHAAGASSALFRAAVAAVLGEPFILTDREIVEAVYAAEGEDTRVVTDQSVYFIPPAAALAPGVSVGAVLRRGDLLTDTVRVYENLDPSRLGADTDAARLREDTAALFLPASLFRAPLRHGLGVTWAEQPIVYAGADANGNPKLKFRLYGTESDIEIFWDDFFAYCEQKGVSSASCFAGHLRDTLLAVEGAVCGSVSPMEYFLANFLKANAVVIAVDSAKLSADGRGAMRTLAACRGALPAHACVFFVERLTVSAGEYDAGEASDQLTAVAAHPLFDEAGGGARPAAGMIYNERVTTRWLPVCHGE